MGVCADPGSYRWCQALSRSRSSFATDHKTLNNNKLKQSYKVILNDKDSNLKQKKNTSETVEVKENSKENARNKKNQNFKAFEGVKETAGRLIPDTITPATIAFSSKLTTPITTRTSISNSIIERRKSRNSLKLVKIKGERRESSVALTSPLSSSKLVPSKSSPSVAPSPFLLSRPPLPSTPSTPPTPASSTTETIIIPTKDSSSISSAFTKEAVASKAIQPLPDLTSFSTKSTKTATKIFNKYFDSNCCQRTKQNSSFSTNTFNTKTITTTTTTKTTITTNSSSLTTTNATISTLNSSTKSTLTTNSKSSLTTLKSSLNPAQRLNDKIRHLLHYHCNHWLSSLKLLLLLISVLFTRTVKANIPEDAVHITAILGEGVVFNCHVEFPNDHPVPYVLQWDKKVSETGSDLPIYIWYESYPEHIEEGYKGRVSRVSLDSPFGSASLNLTNIKESDQGWYECKVVFLNRDPKTHKNGTWFHLDVHAPPRFSVTPEDVIYVNLGDSIILNCQADGTPTPEILWYKDADPVVPSSTVGIFNDGTELRISSIRHEDIGEYTCIARNGEGQVSHTARVIIAGGAVIMVPPTNQTKVEGDKVIFPCEAKAMPGNVTVRWFREGSPVHEVASLESRITIRKDGSLVINPVSADDSGQYLCEVTNGIGDPQSASAFLNIEFPAKVTFTPTVQYLPHGLSGVVQCYIKSNPQLQYVTWTKDKRLLEPYQTKEVVIMSNGSLLFNTVTDENEGRYTCTPFNAKGTAGPSGIMEVFVRKPPNFTVEPESLYQRKVGESVEMHCDAIEAEGTQRPTIKWQRQDGSELSDSQRNRIKISGGNMTIENLRREDFGYYQCVVSNEVATLMSITQLVIEGTQPHAPYNLSGKATESSITLQWMPGYSGGSEYKQEYTIWYRESGAPDWQTISVTPSGSTQVTINSLASGTPYDFKVVGHNALGEGMKSKIMTVRTLEDAPAAPRNVKAATQPPEHVFQHMPDEADLLAYFDIYFHTDSNGSIVYSPPKLKLKGPKPGPPRNVSVTEVSNGFLISWQSPLERVHIVKFYTIKYRTDAQWKTLNRGQIRPEETQYLVKNLVGGRTYYFRVLANSEKSYESSEEVKFPVPARVKHKAITAGVVGGILFFIVAIILSVCAVKICNKRKRRKQEKEFNMVACRITDARNIAANNHHLNHHPNRSTGSLSASQVPLKKYKQTRISSLTTILIAILHWIWPPDRCNNCHSIYSSTHLTEDEENYNKRKSLNEIQRRGDGRFVLHDGTANTYEKRKTQALTNGESEIGGLDEVDGIEARRNSNASQKSSSDDGGFLSRRSFITAKASWRRPLVASPSQLSLQSAADSAKNFLQGLGGLLKIGGAGSTEFSTGGARYQNVFRTPYVNEIYRNLPAIQQGLIINQPQLQLHQSGQPTSKPLHINTVGANAGYHQHQGFNNASLFSPSRVSRLFSSSPASTPNDILHMQHNNVELLNSPWAMKTPNHSQHQTNFSDLSTVYPSSAERSFPTTSATTGNLSRYRYYTQELPSLHTIQEEARRMNQQQQQEINDFSPLQMPSPPAWRNYYQNQMPYYSYRPRTRWYPRHYSKIFGRSQHELLSPLPHLNLSMRGSLGTAAGLEASPESRSSSSGFGSKNTSNMPQGSHHSGSTSEWKLLPPYRPPPPPPNSSGGGILNTAYYGSHSNNANNTNNNLNNSNAGSQQAQGQAPVPHSYRFYVMSPNRPITPPYTMAHWLEMISRLNAATDSNFPKSIDVGSVDGHYEFDPSTPSASTPTGAILRDDFHLPIDSLNGHNILNHQHHNLLQNHPQHHQINSQQNLHHQNSNSNQSNQYHTLGPMSGGSIFHTSSSGLNFSGSATYTPGHVRKLRPPRYDNIEARLQAMKEEFYAYRKQQAIKRAVANELESVC